MKLILATALIFINTELMAISPCGIQGTISARIQNCSKEIDAQKGDFILVTRSATLKEVRLDIKSNILWSDQLPNPMDHYDATNACATMQHEFINIEAEWRLPTNEDFRQAASHNIDLIFSEDNDSRYWSQDLVTMINYRAWIFHLVIDQPKYYILEDDYRSNGTSVFVRCVAMLP